MEVLAQPELSVVIPVHDEVDNVHALTDEVRTALAAKLHYELIFVDDASEDGTTDRLRELLGCRDELRVLHHDRRSGQSTALWSGVRAARAAWVATLDGDLQNVPADILPLYQRARELRGEDRQILVVGQRLRRQDPLPKRLASRLANAVRGWVLQDGTPDTGCGLKVFRREDYLRLPYFDHMHRFLPALVRRAGGIVVSMEVGHRPRPAGRTKYGLLDRLGVGLVDMLGVWWLQRRVRHPQVEEISHKLPTPLQGEQDGNRN